MDTTTQKIVSEFANFEAENRKFEEKGNKTAGTRARKHLSEIAKLCKQRRAEITEAKKPSANI